MTKIALIRHGPTEWNESRRLQGMTDVPLSAAGLDKVRQWRLPDEFAGFDWVASPLTRAAQTARLLGITFRTEPAVREMDWGAWEGRTHRELKLIYGDEVQRRAAMGLDLHPHEGERPRDVRDRIEAWLAKLETGGRPVGAVTHQGVIRAMMSLATGWDMVSDPPLQLDWSSIHVFDLSPDGVAVDRVNISLEAPS